MNKNLFNEITQKELDAIGKVTKKEADLTSLM